MTSTAENTTETITAYGPGLIANAASEMVEFHDDSDTDSEDYDAYNKRMDVVDSLMKTIREETFLETMLYAHTICEQYDIGNEFEGEQRSEAVNLDDWRDTACAGLWHITESAIRKEENQITNENSSIEATTEKTEEYTYDPSVLEMDAQQFVLRALSYHRPDRKARNKAHNDKKSLRTDPLDALDDEDMKHLIGTDADFMQSMLVLNHLTETFNMQDLPTISDSSVREDLSFGSFCQSIQDTIPAEITMNLPDFTNEGCIMDIQ